MLSPDMPLKPVIMWKEDSDGIVMAYPLNTKLIRNLELRRKKT